MSCMNLLRGCVALTTLGLGLVTVRAETSEAAVLKVPADNVVHFNPENRQLQIQLVKPTGVGGNLLVGTKVSMVGPTGRVYRGTADELGMVTLTVPGAGWHGLMISNSEGHAAVPVMVRQLNDDTLPSPGSDPTTLKVPMMDLSPAEALRINRSYLPIAKNEPFIVGESETAMNVATSTSPGYEFQLGNDGSIQGQLAVISAEGLIAAGAGNNVLVYSEGRLISRTTTNDLGQFSVSGLSPGIYGIVSVGPAGYTAFAFDATNEAALSRRNQTQGYTLVSTSSVKSTLVSTTAQQPAPPVVVPVIPPPMVSELPITDENDDDEAALLPDGQPAPGFPGGAPGPGMAGGFGGGGFGGGIGGAAGGGGGLIGLAAAGGIAAAAIAAGTDDNVTPPANTPAQ